MKLLIVNTTPKIDNDIKLRLLLLCRKVKFTWFTKFKNFFAKKIYCIVNGNGLKKYGVLNGAIVISKSVNNKKSYDLKYYVKKFQGSFVISTLSDNSNLTDMKQYQICKVIKIFPRLLGYNIGSLTNMVNRAIIENDLIYKNLPYEERNVILTKLINNFTSIIYATPTSKIFALIQNDIDKKKGAIYAIIPVDSIIGVAKTYYKTFDDLHLKNWFFKLKSIYLPK